MPLLGIQTIQPSEAVACADLESFPRGLFVLHLFGLHADLLSSCCFQAKNGRAQKAREKKLFIAELKGDVDIVDTSRWHTLPIQLDDFDIFRWFISIEITDACSLPAARAGFSLPSQTTSWRALDISAICLVSGRNNFYIDPWNTAAPWKTFEAKLFESQHLQAAIHSLAPWA